MSLAIQSLSFTTIIALPQSITWFPFTTWSVMTDLCLSAVTDLSVPPSEGHTISYLLHFISVVPHSSPLKQSPCFLHILPITTLTTSYGVFNDDITCQNVNVVLVGIIMCTMVIWPCLNINHCTNRYCLANCIYSLIWVRLRKTCVKWY